MANKNFPGPNINRLIESDPQIIKVPMDKTDWGSRPSELSRIGSKPGSNSEMTIKHVADK